MQLKLKRTQRDAGLVSTNVVFCLDARVEFTPEEQQSITRYKLQNQVIYNSESAKRSLDRSMAETERGGVGGMLKGAMHLAITAMKLNVSIASLQRGQHIACKSLDELLAAEDAIMTACENLRAYLDAALTFDGTEVVVDFSTGRPQLVARSSPAKELISPSPLAAPPGPSLLPEPDPAYAQPAEPEGADHAPSDWDTTPPFDIASLFDWNDPVHRKRLFIGVGVLIFILLLRSCWH